MIPLYLWQDGVHQCFDGARYTSGVPQPTPFNRRFHHWPPRLLAVATWVSATGIAVTLGSWQATVMFLTLPGAWFCITHPTCPDLVAMSLAWGAATLWPVHPYAAVALSLASGFVHERGPVFAAVYAWTPWLLVGLLAVQWWAKAVPRSPSGRLADTLTGHTTLGAIKAHKPHQDLLDWQTLVWPLRAVIPVAAWLGASPAAWAALALAYLSRILGTDTSRFMMWAAPPLLARAGACPAWIVALHVMTFRRGV